jgi:hypothetical protein
MHTIPTPPLAGLYDQRFASLEGHLSFLTQSLNQLLHHNQRTPFVPPPFPHQLPSHGTTSFPPIFPSTSTMIPPHIQNDTMSTAPFPQPPPPNRQLYLHLIFIRPSRQLSTHPKLTTNLTIIFTPTKSRRWRKPAQHTPLIQTLPNFKNFNLRLPRWTLTSKISTTSTMHCFSTSSVMTTPP